MKISAVAAHRSSYRRDVADSPIQAANIDGENVIFSILSSQDPGIGSGQYTLTFAINKSEVALIYEAMMFSRSKREIDSLKKENESLKNEVKAIKEHLKSLK